MQTLSEMQDAFLDGSTFYGRVVSRNGARYRVRIIRDEYYRFPWESCDVLGQPNTMGYPGDVALPCAWCYPMREAMEAALKEHNGDKAAARKAVDAEFDYFRGFLAEEWHYIGVVVAPVCPRCGNYNPKKSRSVWGIESNAEEYIETVAQELIDELEQEDVTC